MLVTENGMWWLKNDCGYQNYGDWKWIVGDPNFGDTMLATKILVMEKFVVTTKCGGKNICGDW